MMNVEWFEMTDLKRRSLNRAVWVPLCASDYLISTGISGYVGYQSEYFEAVAIVVPIEQKEKSLSLPWHAVQNRGGHRPWINEDRYIRAGSFSAYEVTGLYPVLEQHFDGDEPIEWYLEQDIVLGLGLQKRNNEWISPEEDRLTVVKIKRNEALDPVSLDIRMEHLRDYLCAKQAGLLVATFRLREIVLGEEPQLEWNNGTASEEQEHYRWQGRVVVIHEGGMPFGGKIHYMHVGRKNFDMGEDVPQYGEPGEDEFAHESGELEDKGKKLFRVVGEMWRNEWIDPGEVSTRIRGDRIESNVRFVVDGSGKTLAGCALEGHNGWLWFGSTAIRDFLKKPQGVLKWYTAETGGTGPKSSLSVHFGVNELGHINVLAKDIALLPEIYQKMWVGHNIPPDGGVCKELLMSQMEARPAKTVAPEVLLNWGIRKLQEVSITHLGSNLLRKNPLADTILTNIHRFHGDSIDGICYLAKELTRAIIERIDMSLLRQLDPNAEKNLKSIKLLEHFLSSFGHDGRRMTSSLVAVYSLRLREAHLPSDDWQEALTILKIKPTEDYQLVAKVLITEVAKSIFQIAQAIEGWQIRDTRIE